MTPRSAVTAGHTRGVRGALRAVSLLRTPCCLALLLVTAGSVTAQSGARAAAPGRPASSRIDELVFGRLQQLGIRPAAVSTDAVFVRRIYLDVIGTLPTAAETRAFLSDASPDKRARLIERLLEREEFADYWALKWADLLRVKSEFPINLWPNAVQAYHQWIRASVRANLPYDQFARALLTESGSNFRVPPVNFYRAVQSREPAALAAAVALTFMGERTEHWPDGRLAAMSVFFAEVGYKSTREWKEEIVFHDREKRGTAAARTATLPDGSAVELSPDTDPRHVFADWLIDPQNPWFTRAIANRVWSWLLGRGIIHEPDDIRADNPPTHPELLAYLERELIDAHYDLKHLFRRILNSQTYQLSSTGAVPADPEADAHFAHYLPRPLDAEVLIDAINQITGGSEQYWSAIPEPYTFVPDGRRSIALADGSITSSFLTTFGRPSRDRGLEAERVRQPSPAERLALLNSSHVQNKIEASTRLQALARSAGAVRGAIAALYLTILSRPPTSEELRAAEAHAAAVNGNRRALIADVAWALINSPEFLYRH